MSDLKAYSVKEAALLLGCSTKAKNAAISVGWRQYDPAAWAEVSQEVLGDLPSAPTKLSHDRRGLKGYRGGLVYFIECGDFIKIGYTSGRIHMRVGNMETANPYPLRVWALLRGNYRTERRFHADLRQFRHRKEWFQIPAAAKTALAERITAHGGEVYD